MGSEIEFVCADCYLIWDRDDANKDCEGAIICDDCSDRHLNRCPECCPTGSDDEINFGIIAHRTRIHRY